jgi:beta-glucosidase
MFNGYVRPDYLYKLLIRLKNDYNNPNIIITENGAGYGDSDEQIVNGKVDDKLRTDYVQRHIAAALQAKKDGVKLQGYFLWSILDNFEWISGYKSRFGIVYVNFETQERIPKNSFYAYKKTIAANKNE